MAEVIDPIIEKDNRIRLEHYSELKGLADNSYLRNPANENFQYIAGRFFDDDYDLAKTLNVGSWIFLSIVQTISYFFDQPRTKNVDILDIQEAIEDYVTLGFAALVVERHRDGYKIVSADSEWFVVENWVPKIYKQYSKYTDEYWKERFLYEKEYYTGRIERKLYKLRWKDDFIGEYDEVDLDTIEETRWLQEVSATGLDRPSIYVVGNPDDTSLIEKVKPQVYSLDRKIVMFDNEFLKNVENIMLMKGINLDQATNQSDNSVFSAERQEIDLTERRIISTDLPDASIEFVSNQNELISKAMEYEKRQINTISSMTNIPLRFLGVDEQDGSSGRNARMLTQSQFIKMLDWYKQKFKKVFKIMLDDIGQDDEISFKDTVLRDNYDLVQEIKQAREARVMSQLKAIKKYQNISMEEAQAELDAIEDEDEKQEMDEAFNEDVGVQLWPDSEDEKQYSPRERDWQD